MLGINVECSSGGLQGEGWQCYIEELQSKDGTKNCDCVSLREVVMLDLAAMRCGD
jgi:hypothetical protein